MKYLYRQFLWFPHFLFSLVLNHDFIIYIDFIRIAASHMATDYVAN